MEKLKTQYGIQLKKTSKYQNSLKIRLFLAAICCSIIPLSGQNTAVSLTMNYEFCTLQSIFDNALFLEKGGNCNGENFITISNVESIPLSFKNEKAASILSEVQLLKVTVFLKQSIINLNMRMGNIESDHLEYYVLTHKNIVYRLFGFYSTNLLLFFKEIGDEGLKCLSDALIRTAILTKNEGKHFNKAFKKNKKEYPLSINKPCVVLSKYYSGKMVSSANTIILPLPPLLKFYVN